MFPGRQDLNFWCCFMCIQSINWPLQFAEVIRGKHQKPITVSRTLNQTDMSLKRYGHEKLSGGFLRRLKIWSIFHLSWLLWSTVFSPTVTGSSLSMNTNNLADIALISASAAKWVKKDTYSTQDIKVILLMCFVTFFVFLICFVILTHVPLKHVEKG